ncbi:hypothetical protein MNB_SV-6-558 [hydrothermal vent metagenome]|uniref:Uncharacterized protein n=1 Tax=hydrothermal vent metagenome TaxID=652676 RepID=A0A1W1CB43_9ZZZZ
MGHLFTYTVWEKYKPYLFIGFFSFLVVLLQYHVGFECSWDSLWYILFADWIGNSLNFDRLAVYPPLYYETLGFFKLFGLSTISTILLYWWICYYIIITLFYSLTRNITVSILALLAILSNIDLWNTYRTIWTEMGYSVLLLTALHSLYKYLNSVDSKNSYKYLFLFSIAMLPIQRYIGVYISIYLGLIYLFSSKKDLLQRFYDLMMAITPLLFVLAWNYLLSGFVAGPREPSPYSFAKNFHMSRDVLSGNFHIESVFYIVISLFLIISMLKRRRFSSLFLLLLVPAIEVFFQIVSNTQYNINIINQRYFVVLVPSVVLLITLFIEGQFKKRNKIMISLMLASYMIIIGYNVKRHYNAYITNPTQNYMKVKNYLFNIKAPSKIGVFTGGYQHYGSDYILLDQIIPLAHCHKYKSVAKFNMLTKEYADGLRDFEGIYYLPTCSNTIGHIYAPLTRELKNSPDNILVSKRRLPRDWRNMFKGYRVENLGEFYGLSK